MSAPRALFALGTAVMLAACGSSPRVAYVEAPSTVRPVDGGVLPTTYAAVDELVSRAGHSVSRIAPVLVTSVTEMGDHERSTPFSRLIGEAAASRLAQHGYPIHEARLREDALLVRRNGEFVVTREANAPPPELAAEAILVGSYAAGTDTVFVALKLLSAGDGAVLGAADYAVPMTEDIRRLVLPGLIRITDQPRAAR